MSQELKQVIRQEYVKCAKDPVHFMKKYCYIQHPQRGRILFHLFPFQETTLNHFQDNDYSIILKSRQLGISTLAAGFSLWLMTFHKDKNILTLATTQATARNLVTKVQFMYENLPTWLRVGSAEKNKLSLRLVNGSKITAKSSNADAARSEAVSLLIIDEAAFIDNIAETWASAQQTLATGGGAIVLSCVVGDTYVTTSEGIKQVKDFITEKQEPGFNTVKPYHILGKGKIREGHQFYRNGTVPTLKIHSKNAQLEGSENHKLYTFSGNTYGWNKLETLKVGDFVAVQGGHRIWGNNDTLNYQNIAKNRKKLNFNTEEITPDLSYLFGLYLAEGSSNGTTTIDITCGDDQDIDRELNKLDLYYSRTDGRLAKRLCSTSLVDIFNKVGFELGEHTALTKFLPKKILSMSEKNIAAVVQGMFDGDGCATVKGLVTYASISKDLVEGLRSILLNFGVYSRVYVRTALHSNAYVASKREQGCEWAFEWNKHKHDCYILEITGEGLEIFHKHIGFRIDRKQLNLKTSVHNYKKQTRKSTLDLIPAGDNLIKLLYDRSELSQYSFIKESEKSLSNILNKTRSRKTIHCSRATVKVVFSKWKHLLNEEELTHWDNILDDRIRWNIIKEITEGVSETYDFSLPDNIKTEGEWCHSVIYNGMVGHQTPFGTGNWFHKTWCAAETGENAFLPIKLPWFVHPERDQTWRDSQDAQLGDPRLAAQECDVTFSTSGDTVIYGDLIEFYEETYRKDPVERRGVDRNLWIWEPVDYSRNYMVVADVARGDGKDFSAFHIIDIETCSQVGEYKGQLPPKEFAHLLVGISTEYNNALLVVENANIGWSTIETVQERGYTNLYHSPKSGNVTSESYFDPHGLNTNMTPGFSNTLKTRPLIIAKLQESINDKSAIIHSKRMLDELKVFIWRNNRAEAQGGYNDDLTMSWAIAMYVRESAFRIQTGNANIVRSVWENITTTNNNPDIIYTPQSANNPTQIDNGKGGFEDMSWIYK